MPGPRLEDDGRTVTLDVHGLTVDEALHLIERVLATAYDRGRTLVRVIHGSSTSSPAYRNRSIKRALHERLDRKAWPSLVVQARRAEDTTTLALPLATRQDPTKITLRSVWS